MFDQGSFSQRLGAGSVVRPLFVGLFVATLACAAAGQPARDERLAREDWQALAAHVSEYHKRYETKEALEGGGRHIASDWLEWKRDFGELMAVFSDRYGATPAKVGEAFADVAAPLDVEKAPADLFADARAIDVAAHEEVLANWALDLAREAYREWDGMHQPEPAEMETKLRRAEEALAFFELAQQLNPQGDYGDYVEEAEEARAATEVRFREALGDLTWPGHHPEFAGPGDPDALAAAALAYLDTGAYWPAPEYDDTHTPVAACVFGTEWEAQESPGSGGEPGRYSLDILVAFAGEGDPEVVYCYPMVFYTAEGPGAEPRPPFMYACSMPGAFRLLAARVPARDEGRRKPTSGLAGWLFRAGLAAAMALGSVLAASGRSFESRLTWAARIRRVLLPGRAFVGLVLAAAGAACFLRATFSYWAPLADCLPQVLCVLLGLAMARPLFPGGGPSPAREKAAEPTRTSFLIRTLNVLEHGETGLGWMCLAFGLAHFVCGGLWLL